MKEIWMKRFLSATIMTAAAFAATSSGFAQGMPANQDPAMPAVATSSKTTQIEPAAGSNSFTEKQASARLAKSGFTKVSGLAKDDSGVWRGTAMKKGVKHNVAVDYQGNVTSE
jgi:hypothetical protein